MGNGFWQWGMVWNIRVLILLVRFMAASKVLGEESVKEQPENK
jgi:hypothetical protein